MLAYKFITFSNIFHNGFFYTIVFDLKLIYIYIVFKCDNLINLYRLN